MVHIKKVEIYGFKSFGFTNKIVNLDEGLVCITGPNGSGKSNILDAIAFALGENSPKTLRVDRLHSLIHDNETRRKHLRVSITFDNKDRGIPIDSNTVTITRELPLNGDSNYLLNGKHVSKSTITDLLEVAFASPNKLNNVQQGMIMRIAELNIDERRRILEDIIGLSYFDNKKEEAIKQLNEADRKLEIALARMGEIRKRIDELELERNNQIRFHYLEKQIRRLNAIRISNTIKEYRKRMKELRMLIEEKSKEEKELSQKLAEIRGELASLESERSNIMKEVDRSTRSKAEINTKISDLINRIEELKATKNASENRIRVIGNTIPSLIKEKEEIEKKNVAVTKEIERLEEQVRVLSKEREGVASNIKELNEILDRLNKELNEINSKENKFGSMLRDREEELAKVKGKLAENSERLKIVEENINTNITKLRSIKEEISKLESMLIELNDIKKKEEIEFMKINKEIDRLNDNKKRLSQYIDEALGILEHAMKISARYDARINASKEVSTEEYSIAMLLKDGDDKIVGVVKDLISYDKRYNKAIIAVASEWLNTIVVNSISDALMIIERAKAMNLQRVKVIPLDMIDRLEFESRLSEVVNTRYKKLADFILDAYLANSILEARRIAEEGKNAVTLDGEMFYANSSSIKLNQIGRLKDLTKMMLLTQSVDDLKDVLAKLDKIIMMKKERLKDIENRLEVYKNKSIDEQGVLNKIDMQITNIKEQLERYRNNLASINKRVDENQVTKEKLIQEIREMNYKQTGMLKDIDDIKDELSAIKKDDIVRRINEISSTKASLVSKLDAIEDSHRDILTRLSTRHAEYNNASKRLEDIEREMMELKREARERKEMIENTISNLADIERELREARDIEQKMIDTSANSVTLLKEYDEKIKGVSEHERKMTKQHASIERDLAINKREISDLAINLSKLREELTNTGYEEVNENIDVELILKELTKEYDSIKSTVNQLADKSYKQLIEGYRGMSERRNQLEEERNSIVRFIEGIDNEKKKIFMESFEKVDKDVRHIFATMTDNLGSAWLEIEDPENVFDSGLSLMIQFPNKPPRESTSLSGGEKTIAAITFLLALQSLKPSPYYLFDEVDAHLDAQNTERLLKILLERSKVSQMIVVTLKDMIVAHANLVYGVYARNGVSNVIKYRSKVEMAKWDQ